MRAELDERFPGKVFESVIRQSIAYAESAERAIPILDYRPESTLVVEEHPVPRARFPVVDIHSHTGPTPETIERLIKEMDAMNLRVLVKA